MNLRRILHTPFLVITVVSCVAPALAGPASWINDGSDGAPRLSVEQSIWAMGKLPRGGKEWSREEKFAKIAGAGFDGVMVFLPRVPADQESYAALAKKHGLAITLQCAPATVDDLRFALAAAKRMNARGVVAMIRPTFITYEDGRRKIAAMMQTARDAGVPFYLETHRGTITQDIVLTRRWAETVGGIQFHADLSHFVASYEVGGKARGEIKRAFDAVLARTGMLDGRIGNGEQVQIDIGPNAESPHAARFAAWWKQAMVNWLKQAGPGDVFVFKSELGPPPYSIVGTDGAEISDRWAQALVVRDLGIRTWNAAIQEAGKGQPYVAKGAVTAKSVGSGGGKPARPTGKPELADIFIVRGDCYKIGDYYLSGQLAQPAYEEARKLGVKTVINVRMRREMGGLGFDVKSTVEGIELKYHHIPVAPANMDDARAKLLIDTIRNAKKPVMIQGSNGNRVWGIWALYSGVEWGVPVDETKAVATQCEIKKLVIDDFVRAYLAKLKK